MNALNTTTTESILCNLRAHIETQGDATAYTFLKSDDERLSITYRELDRRARSIAHGLLQQAEPGDRALMMFPAGLEFIEAFLGCIYSGIVAVPAYPPKKNRNAERILSIANDCTPRLLLCTSETKRNVEGEFAESVTNASVIITNELDSACNGGLPDIRSAQLAFLQYTSGSTATPKGVMVSHGNIIANEELCQKYFQLTKQSIMVSWLPMFHDMGLIGGILAPLFVGFPSILMPPSDFLREPIKWLLALTEFRGTCTGAPNFAYDLCVRKVTGDQKNKLDLSSLTIAYNGAEPVRARTLECFANAFALCGLRKEACSPCYGMAETTLLVSGGPPLAQTRVLTIDASKLAQHRIVENEDGQHIVSCGQIGADLEVRIVDPETFQECHQNEVGEIWVFGDSVAKGYWNRLDETQQSFQARLKSDDRFWLRTGDYGFVQAGELYVTGRLKDLIIIRGRNIYPQDIEQLVEQHLDFIELNSCAAFSIDEACEEKLVIVAEGSWDMIGWTKLNGDTRSEQAYLNHKIEELRTAVLDTFDVSLADLVFVRPATFPRTSSGKVQRRVAKQKFLQKELELVFESTNGTLDSVDLHQSESGEMLDLVCRTLEEWARDEGKSFTDLHGNTTFASLGIDSLAAADIGIRLERKLGVSVEGDTLYQQRSIGDLAEHLKQRLSLATKQLAGGRSRKSDNSASFKPTLADTKAPTNDSAEVSSVQDANALEARPAHDFAERNQVSQRMKAAGMYFYGTPYSAIDGAYVTCEGRRMLMLASFAYTGLIGHPEVNAAAKQAIDDLGAGCHGVRLIAGTTSVHRELEVQLAKFVQADDALLFSSGYATNVATIPALVGPGDSIFADEFNHASLVDGCKLSGASFEIFSHNQVDDLEQRLQRSTDGRRLVIVDGVYSMEGDIAPLPQIVALCRRYEAILMVDEAHSLGVIGKTGRGVQEHFGLSPDAIDIKMGNTSKSLASLGGFIAGKQPLIDYLRHNARGYVFSTSLGPPQVAAALKALELLQREPERVTRLQRNALRLIQGLREAGFRLSKTESAIVPLLCESTEHALEMTARCRDAGLFVIPIVYPAVPMNAPRLRLNVMATHTEEQIDWALSVLVKAGREVGIV